MHSLQPGMIELRRLYKRCLAFPGGSDLRQEPRCGEVDLEVRLSLRGRSVTWTGAKAIHERVASVACVALRELEIGTPTSQ